MLNKKLIAVIAVVVIVVVATVCVYAEIGIQQELQKKAAEAAKPRVVAEYYGENMVPPGLEEGFPADTLPAGGPQVNYYYSWNITAYNLNPTQGWGDTVKDIFDSEISKYPQLATYTLFGDTYVIGGGAFYNANMSKMCQVAYATAHLSPEQIQGITDDLNAQLGPALIAYYS